MRQDLVVVNVVVVVTVSLWRLGDNSSGSTTTRSGATCPAVTEVGEADRTIVSWQSPAAWGAVITCCSEAQAFALGLVMVMMMMIMLLSYYPFSLSAKGSDPRSFSTFSLLTEGCQQARKQCDR